MIVPLLLLVCACRQPTAGSKVSATNGDARSSSTPASTTDGYAGDVNRIIEIHTADGLRTALIHHPTRAKPGAPLVVALHPAATSASAMEAGFGWDGIADREGLIVVYPEGLLDSFQDTWNGGGCCAPASQLHTDDVKFLDTLVSAVRQYDGVGRAVYAVGFSNGAIMAYAWACARPGELAGIGVVAGAVMSNCANPSPLTVIAVHGTADPAIPIGGGTGPDGTRFPSLESSLAPFRTADGCDAKPAVNRTNSATISTWVCRGGREVVSDVVAGLGHAWPGGGPGAGSTTGPRDATGFLWAHLHRGDTAGAVTNTVTKQTA